MRFFVLQKFRTYWELSSGFCSFDQWDEKYTQNFFNLLSRLYLKLYECVFDFECCIIKFKKVRRHLSLFSICTHYMRCVRSCDDLSKSKYCFHCSHVRMLDYACSSNFYDIDMYPRDFSENFPNLVDYSTVDLDIHLDPMPSFDNSLKERSSLCKQFNVDTRPGHLFISFRVFWFACISIMLWRPYLTLI